MWLCECVNASVRAQCSCVRVSRRSYGSIVSTKAILDSDSGACKGYGFVDFETNEAAEHALADLLRRGVQAQMAKRQESDLTNLYFQNLPLNWTEEELRRLCAQFGVVLSCRVLRHQSRGAAYASFPSRIL